MWRGEVEGRPGALFYPLVIVELCPVVSRDGRKRPLMPEDEPNDSSVQRRGRPISELADQHQPGLALDQRDDAVCAARTHHGVDLPMPDLPARLDLLRALRDEALACEPAAAVVSPVALPAPLAGATQVGVEETSLALIPPDVAVDSLVANRELPGAGQVPSDLFGTPLAAEQPVDEREVCCRKAAVAARAEAAPVGALLGLAGAVVAVRARAVAAELAADRAAVAAQGAGHLRLRQALHSECGEHIPLVGGELVVRHD